MSNDPEQQGLNLDDLFITRREFHKYVIDNRDRQDVNKSEILDAIHKQTRALKADLKDDIGDLEQSVEKLEDDAKKQTIIAAAIAGAVSLITAGITAAVAIAKGG